MFHKNSTKAIVKATPRKDTTPSVLTKDVNIIGNIISDGNIDFDGTLNGNIRCSTLTIRPNGCVKGEIVANSVLVYGIIKGLIRAKHVQLFAHCNVEGISSKMKVISHLTMGLPQNPRFWKISA